MARTSYPIDGARVGQARLALGLTQTELADRIGVHRVTMTKIEGGAPVSLETLEALSVELVRSREWLCGEPDQVDEFDLARERIANAMSKIADGFEDFQEAVIVLEERARHAGAVEVEA